MERERDRMKLPLSRIAQFLGTTVPKGVTEATATGFSIDSRTIRPGEVFFAVKGEKMDGHDFVQQAIGNGALAAVVSVEKRRQLPSDLPLIEVADTLVALQTLATAVRKLWGKPLVGVTGSAGKTTTKEAIAHVLATRLRVHKSEGNFNNHFGLPLMLLKLEPEHDIAVIEMGMSHAGEIAALAKIAQPETGVVTNVAPVHLEFFASISDIARAKYELIQSLPPNGTAVLNADDEYVSQFGRDFQGKVVQYGLGSGANVRAENFQSRGEQGSIFNVVVGEHREAASLPLVGAHNVHNALAAVAVAIEHGFTLAAASAALATLVPADKRGQVVRLGNITVINDCYNSNPKALAAMVDALASMPPGTRGRRIVVAGEMLELGPLGAEMHRDSGRYIGQKGIDFLIGVRGMAEGMVNAVSGTSTVGHFVSTPEQAGEWLHGNARDGDIVLMKASRGVKLEKALETWKSLANIA
jgi:UDP-N-acetylmuramoyl-tripeptide--D-alanyl-D-alanine ligase